MGTLITEFSVRFYHVRCYDHLPLVYWLAVGDRTVLLCYEQEVYTLRYPPADPVVDMPVH